MIWKNLLEEDYHSNSVIEAFREAKYIARFEVKNLHCFLLGDMYHQHKGEEHLSSTIIEAFREANYNKVLSKNFLGTFSY